MAKQLDTNNMNTKVELKMYMVCGINSRDLLINLINQFEIELEKHINEINLKHSQINFETIAGAEY